MPAEARTHTGRRLVVPIAVVAVLVGVVLFIEGVRPHIVPKRFSEVVHGKIYRAGKLTSRAMADVVAEHNIKTIIDLGAYERGSSGDQRLARTAQALGATRYRFDLVGDSTGDPNDYVDVLRILIDPASQPVLVHCGAGTERTGCTVALYRHYFEGVPLSRAFAEADAKGHDPSDNPLLLRTLLDWSPAIEHALRTGERIPASHTSSLEREPKLTAADVLAAAKAKARTTSAAPTTEAHEVPAEQASTTPRTGG